MRPPALLVVVGMMACATAPVARAPVPEWHLLADEVRLVVDDPSVDAIYVRGHGKTAAFGGHGAPVPSLDEVPDHAQAFITAARGLRWRVGGGRWHGWDPGPGRPPDARPNPLAAMTLPPESIVDGVLVRVPFLGPEQGLPEPLALLDPGTTVANAVAAARDAIALVASSRGVTTLALAQGTRRSFPHGAPVVPAISSDGLFEAAALGTVSLALQRGAAPVPREVVGLFSGAKPLRAWPLRQRPVSLHFAAGALFAELPDHTLWRHELGVVTHPRLTPEEQALLRSRDALERALEQALDANDVAGAIDSLDALYARGFMDLPSPAAQALAAQARARARPLFERAVQKALAAGDFDLALVLDRRMTLIDGHGAGAEAASVPTLQVALTAEPGAAVTERELDHLITEHRELQRVQRCLPHAQRGPASVCLELKFLARPAGSIATVREVAVRELARKTAGDQPTHRAFASAMSALGSVLAQVKLNDGGLLTLAVPCGPGECAEDAVSEAVAAQAAVAAKSPGPSTRVERLRLLLWQHDPATALEEAVRGDATTAAWLIAR